MKSAALGPRHERNSAIVIAVWHGVRHEKRSAKLQLMIAPFCAMCLDNGIVRPAEIADHIVPPRGDVNSSPTLAHHNLDQTSPRSFSIARTSGLLERSRVRKPKEESAWEWQENFWDCQKPAFAARHSHACRTE